MTENLTEKIISRPYFSHDVFTRAQDKKMEKMLFEFGQQSNEKSWCAYGVFWAIVEYLHHSDIAVDDIKMIAYNLRIDSDLVNSILNDFDLFIKKDGFYISNRVNRNLETQQEKSKNAQENAKKRWAKLEALIDNIIAYYAQVFDKDYTVSESTKKAIAAIINKNKTIFQDKPLEKWQTIINNAKRGWDYPDGKHVELTMNDILKKWDAILNNDCHLSENIKETVQEKDARIRDAAIAQCAAEAATIKDDALYETIQDKASAIYYLTNSELLPAAGTGLKNHSTFKALSKKYEIEMQELIQARAEGEE